MKIEFKNYPVDVIVCVIWSIYLLPLTLFNIQGIVRIVLGLPLILFIPGYILIFALFPSKKKDRGIDIIERIALSFGLSIAIVPLIGLALNYTPWGIRLEPILISIFGFTLIIGIIGIYRWYKTNTDERFVISLNLSINKSESTLDKILTIILAITIIIAAVSLIYVIITPKIGEKFTEFYILGPGGKADDYPRNLTRGENASVIIGIVNHEYRSVNYTLEVWLVNQSFIINETTNVSTAIYNHMWFLNKIFITLNHTPIDIEQPWKPQWEYYYNFSINLTGNLKLAFLLYTSYNFVNYSADVDYKEIAYVKLDEEYGNADYKLHLWLNVKQN